MNILTTKIKHNCIRGKNLISITIKF
ncbi:hypothetical protein YPPY48_2378, partial [Yersinia pestis PY-48]